MAMEEGMGVECRGGACGGACGGWVVSWEHM